jgi:hypothetical protein
MKTTVTALSFACAGSAILPVLALVPLQPAVLSVGLAVLVGSLITGFAWADYTRKPQFRLPRHPAAARQVRMAEHSAAADWTYQTVSA